MAYFLSQTKNKSEQSELCSDVAEMERLELALQALLRCPKPADVPFVTAGFDRGASPSSLHPPPAAVGSAARA